VHINLVLLCYSSICKDKNTVQYAGHADIHRLPSNSAADNDLTMSKTWTSCKCDHFWRIFRQI